MKDIYIGPIIKEKVLESSMTIQEFANKINCDRTTVYDIFKRKSIDTERLLRISQVLGFDFVNRVYHNQETLPQKSQTIFIAIEVDKEIFKNLNLPDNFTKFIKDHE